MTILSIRLQDLEISRRVEEFQNAVATITKVDFVPDDQNSFERGHLVRGFRRHTRRLALAYRMLSDPRNAGNSITGIAMDSGFGNLS